LSLENLVIIVVAMVLISIPFLYYWLKSLKFGAKKEPRSADFAETALLDINISEFIS